MDRHPVTAGHAGRWPRGWPRGWRWSLPGHAAQLYECVRFEVVRGLRSRQYLILALALPVALYLAATQPGLLGRPGAPIDGMTWATYAMVSMAALGALGAGLTVGGSRLAVERESGWVRTLAIVPVARLPMLAGRVVAGVIVAGPPIVAAIAAAVLVRGVGLSPGSWLQLIASVWLGSLPFALLGVAVGLSLGRAAALGAVLVLYLGLALIGGLFEPLDALAGIVATIGRVLPSFLVGDLGWHAVLGRGPSARDITVLTAESLAVGSFIVWRRGD